MGTWRKGIFAADPGRTPLRQIEQMGQSLCSFAIGVSLPRVIAAGPALPGEVIALPHLMTLERCDTFIHQAKISGRAFPPGLERQRGQLQDAMIDCHMWLPGPAHGDGGGGRSAGGVV
jgi:nitrogenase molybdenum-iron protein NifN